MATLNNDRHCDTCLYSSTGSSPKAHCQRRAPVHDPKSPNWPTFPTITLQSDWCGEYDLDISKVGPTLRDEGREELRRQFGDRRDWDGLERMDARRADLD